MKTLALTIVVVAALALPAGGGLAVAASSSLDAPSAGNATGVSGNTTDTVDDTTDSADDTTTNATDAVDDATENTTDAVDDTVNDTTDTVDDTTDSVGTATSVQTETVTPASGNGTPTATATASRTTTRNGTGATGDRSDAGGGAGGAGTSDGRRSGGFGPADGALAVGVGATLAVALTRRTATTAALGVVPDVPAVRAVATTGRRATRTAITAGREAVGDRLYRLLGLLGYSRHVDDPLDHGTRESLYRRIRTTPGQHLSALDDGTDGSFSTVRHHLGVLEREGLVTSHRVRGRRRYFPAGVEEPELVSALVDDSTAAVLRALSRTGPAAVSDLAAELDRDPSTVTHHLQRLAEDGLVERERDGRQVVTSLVPGVAAALDDGPVRASSD